MIEVLPLDLPIPLPRAKSRGKQEVEMSRAEKKIAELGINLPRAAAPVANYVPYAIAGSLRVISGQLCLGLDGAIAPEHKGKLGGAVTPEAGKEAARRAALNVLAQAKAAVGDLDRIKRCLRLGGFINATPDFATLPQVMNGASDVVVEILGDAGRHARTTVGVAQLPLDAAVEVEALFEIG
jgi:enamine deaminase RidA (YjgF/YER057c/UK114 family)